MLTTKNLLERYEIISKLGEGTYGVVYQCYDRFKSTYIAMKKIRIDSYDDVGIPYNTLREICILKQLKHNNIVKLYDIISDNNRIYIIFEFIERDLRHYLDHAKSISPELIKSYLHQLLLGVAYCHKQKILHRDLKPSNLLIDRVGNLKIADFGLSRNFNIPFKSYSPKVVTLWYRAPELLLNITPYNAALDIWSIGCIFIELFTRIPFLQGDTETTQLYCIFNKIGIPTEDSWPELFTTPMFEHLLQLPHTEFLNPYPDLIEPQAFDLIRRMLILKPEDRIVATEALSHPYFECYHDWDLKVQSINEENDTNLERQFNDIQRGFGKVLSFDNINSPKKSSKLKLVEIDESDKENSHSKNKPLNSGEFTYFKIPTYKTSGQTKFTLK